MATKDTAIPTGGYSSTVRKTLLLGKDGTTPADTANPVPVDAVVTVDTMNLTAELSEATGQDYYVTTTNAGDGTLTIGFDDASGNTVAGALALQDVIKIENKTQSWVYNTKGATVTDTSILLVAANQTTGYPVPGITDEFEIVFRGKDRLPQNVVDDSAMPATPNIIPVGGEYRDTLTVYTDGDATVLQTDANGKLRITGGGSAAGGSGVMVGYEIGTYAFDASAQTVTITGMGSITIERVLKIVNVTDQETLYDISDTSKGGTISGNVITLEYDTTAMADADSLQIFVQYNNSEDYDLGVTKTIDQAPPNSKYTSPEAYTVFTPVDTAYDEGAVIDVRGYNVLNLMYTKTASTDDNTYIKVIGLMTSDGTVDFQETSISSPAGGVTTISANVYERDKAALVEMIAIPTNGLPFIRIDMAKVTDDGDDSVITCYINKAWI